MLYVYVTTVTGIDGLGMHMDRVSLNPELKADEVRDVLWALIKTDAVLETILTTQSDGLEKGLNPEFIISEHQKPQLVRYQN